MNSTMKNRLLLIVFFVICLAACVTEPSKGPGVKYFAFYIDGYCVANRWARSPVGYYHDMQGKVALEKYLKAADESLSACDLEPKTMAEIETIVFNGSTSEEDAGNFFIRCFRSDGVSVSKSLTRDQLRAIIKMIPSDKRGGLEVMCEKG